MIQIEGRNVVNLYPYRFRFLIVPYCSVIYRWVTDLRMKFQCNWKGTWNRKRRKGKYENSRLYICTYTIQAFPIPAYTYMHTHTHIYTHIPRTYACTLFRFSARLEKKQDSLNLKVQREAAAPTHIAIGGPPLPRRNVGYILKRYQDRGYYYRMRRWIQCTHTFRVFACEFRAGCIRVRKCTLGEI